MSLLSLGKYLETLLGDHTDNESKVVDVYGVAKDLGFIIQKVSMFGAEAGALIPNPPQPFKKTNPDADIYKSRIELNKTLKDSTLRPVVAWLIAEYLMCGNPKTTKTFKCDIFATRSWRSYQTCPQMFLATRLLMPTEIIDAYCQKLMPGVPIFDSAGYAKTANIDHTFVQCCYANSDVSGLLGLVSELEIKMSTSMKDLLESKYSPEKQQVDA